MNRTAHILVTLLAVSAFAACGKNNPDDHGQQGGGGSEPQKNTPVVILSQDFTKGLGSFTIQVKDKGGLSKSIWKYDNSSEKTKSYGAQASASDGAIFAAESWLISPEIDLTNYTDANLYFNHAFAYASKKVDKKILTTDPKEHFFVKVSSDDGATWKDREVPKWLASHSYFELCQSGNISLAEFKGKKIKFAFVYKSTKEFAPTWEITDVTVSYERQNLLLDDNGEAFKASAKGMMEMPAIADEANFFAHTTILRFSRVRNFAFSYNPDALVANWVAYPLYDEFSRNNKDTKVYRYDDVVPTNQAWVSDPLLVAMKKPTINVASSGSYQWSSKGYSRGHQLPSADRQGGAMANIQTFYTSNVAPQSTQFNGGIWEKLESSVRNWSSSSNSTDTLYVVTGCLVDKDCPTVSDHDGKEVAIPKAYYKALLRLSKGNYIGAGFYMDHKEYPNTETLKDHAVSLKELEAKTGMTFFVNLPAETATKVKAEDPKNNAFWNLK